MRISEVTYGRKVNLGNYESEEYRLTALVDEKEDGVYVAECLKHKVDLLLGLKKDGAKKPVEEVAIEADAQVVAEKVEEPAKEEPKKSGAVKGKATKKKVTKKTSEKDVEESPEVQAEVVTLETVQAKLKEVYKLRGKEVYQEIMNNFGVNKSSELNESEYAKVVAECDKAVK